MDTYTLLYLKWINNCIAHGTLLNIMWQPGWEGSLGENGYMYMHGQSLHHSPSHLELSLLIGYLQYKIISLKKKNKKDVKPYPRYSKSTIPG